MTDAKPGHPEFGYSDEDAAREDDDMTRVNEDGITIQNNGRGRRVFTLNAVGAKTESNPRFGEVSVWVNRDQQRPYLHLSEEEAYDLYSVLGALLDWVDEHGIQRQDAAEREMRTQRGAGG